MRDLDIIGWVLVAFIGGLGLLLIFMAGNHLSGKDIGPTTAEAYSQRYVEAWTEYTQIPQTDSKGNTTGYTTVQTYHPEEWHVYWRAEGLTYDQSTSANFGGFKVDDRRQLMVREGGWAHDRYLWEPG